MKVFSVFLAICLSATAFSPLADRRLGSIGGQTRSTTSSSSFPLFAGGFGGGGKKSKGSSNKSASKPTKLKPKQQWDRYLDMKTETKIAVGVRMKEDDSDDWFQVGHIRSKDGAHTTLSVAIQRALIAEHAKRLYPLKISGKKTLEWAFLDGDAWTIVDKSILDEQTPPEGIEKQIGFEGRPDPASGFYCVYDGGKLKVGEESSLK